MPKPSVVFHFIVFPFAFPMPLGSVSFSQRTNWRTPICEFEPLETRRKRILSLYMATDGVELACPGVSLLGIVQ